MEWQKRFLTHFHWCSLVSFIWELQTVQDTKKECVLLFGVQSLDVSDKTRSLIVLYNYHLSLCVCVLQHTHTPPQSSEIRVFRFIVSIFIESGKCNRCILSLQYCIISHTWRLDIGISHFLIFAHFHLCSSVWICSNWVKQDLLKLNKANGVGCLFLVVSVVVL